MKYEIRKTQTFDKWLSRLKDRQAVASITTRMLRIEQGNFGDFSSVGGGVCELRIFVGKGYRLYYTLVDTHVVLLLCGGHKGTQGKDIDTAKKLLKNLE